MENNNDIYSNPISFSGVLTIAFIVLKLCNVIDWSWWWVLCPIWIHFALGAFILLVIAIVCIFAILMNVRK